MPQPPDAFNSHPRVLPKAIDQPWYPGEVFSASGDNHFPRTGVYHSRSESRVLAHAVQDLGTLFQGVLCASILMSPVIHYRRASREVHDGDL